MNNREFLKDFMRGYDGLSDNGITPKMWLIMEAGEYNKETVEACKGLLQWYKRVNKIADRESCFYSYLKGLVSKGFDIGEI